MKKLFLSLIALLATVAASAQVYVGGEVGLWRNTDDNHTLVRDKMPHLKAIIIILNKVTCT